MTFSTLASTLKLFLGLPLCHQTIDSFRFSGGDDGARTRDLCRDRLPVTDSKRLTTTSEPPKHIEVAQDALFCG